jgi:DNA-binding SARP family transcriptional activator
MNSYPLRFFGPGLIADANGQPVAMSARKQLALLVYLVTEHPIAHSRESLLTLFWPEETTAGAQNNLRVTLSRLRELAGKVVATGAALPDLLITDRHSEQPSACSHQPQPMRAMSNLVAPSRATRFG